MRKRERVQFKSDLPSRTQQHMKQEADVNSIMEKYRRTGLITNVRNSQPSYGDFSNMKDFQSNINQVLAAQETFSHLPAVIRKRFSNNPQSLIDFISDDSNYEEALKLGLVAQKAAPNDDKTTITQAKPATPAQA